MELLIVLTLYLTHTPDRPQNTYSGTIGFDWKGFSVMAQFYGVNNTTRTVGYTNFDGGVNLAYDLGHLLDC